MRFRFDPHIAIAVALVPVAAVILALGPRGSQPEARGRKPQAYDYKPMPRMTPGGVPMRPMDNDIFAAVEKGQFTRAQLLDLFPDRPYHVKLVWDSVERWVSFVLIDLDRKGRWDERWELKKDGAIRHLIAGPDSPDEIMFTLRAGYWIPH